MAVSLQINLPIIILNHDIQQNHDGGMAEPVRGVNKNTANEATKVWFFSPGFLNFVKTF